MKNRLLAGMVVTAFAVAVLTGCGSSTGTADQNLSEGNPISGEAGEEKNISVETDQPYIAMIALGYSHQFWQAVKSGADQAAADYNVKITFEGPEQETMVDKQIDMLKTAIANEPSAICMAAIDIQAAAPDLQAEKDAGVPLVGFDSGIGDYADVTCSVDNAAAGALAADMVAERLGESGKVAILGHSETTEDAVARVDGFKEEIAKYPHIEIVDEQYGDGDQLKSAEIAKGMVTANPDLKLIYTTNEGACVGAYNGLKELGVIGKVDISGFDSSAALKAAVRSGEIFGAIAQDPVTEGYKTVESAVRLIRGEESENVFIDCGFYWYNAENMDDSEIAACLYD